MLKALYEAIRRDAAPTTLEIDGRTYASASLAPVRTPTPEPLTHAKRPSGRRPAVARRA